MYKKLLFALLFVFCTRVSFAQQIQSPSDFLGYKLGTQFTSHARVVDYFRYVANASKNVRLLQYGTTNEGRPLLVVFIGSDENINRLEDIRHYNLSLTGQGDDHVELKNAPVIVWLSYNVHGNEPSSSEASMQALFDLADPTNEQSKNWLKNTLVVIDPCLNPDGRERYVNFYRSASGTHTHRPPNLPTCSSLSLDSRGQAGSRDGEGSRLTHLHGQLHGVAHQATWQQHTVVGSCRQADRSGGRGQQRVAGRRIGQGGGDSKELQAGG